MRFFFFVQLLMTINLIFFYKGRVALTFSTVYFVFNFYTFCNALVSNC